jgi:sensor histidine kinase YesM
MNSQYTLLPATHLIPHIIINFIWAVTIFYLFYVHFIKYFEEVRFVKYLIYSLLSSIVIALIFINIHKFYLPSLKVFTIDGLVPHIIGTFILAQCGSLVKGFENWVDNIKIKAELENRNLKNELELLKSQINPHFLFNTLNNIDTLIHKSPDDASRSLITLSDMLRYMIYETNVPLVPLDKEIEYLKYYIELQKLRISDHTILKLDIENTCKKATIAPMLLLPFVENAFKYVSTDVELPAIEILIKCEDQNLEFNCKNYYSNTNSKNIHSGGVGLENVKRRLELIYARNYSLQISEENHIFNVNLKINLL